MDINAIDHAYTILVYIIWIYNSVHLCCMLYIVWREYFAFYCVANLIAYQRKIKQKKETQ